VEAVHYPVLFREVIQNMVPPPSGGTLIDCTTGEGGHSKLFLEKHERLHVIGLDRDCQIQERAKERLRDFGGRFEPVLCWFDDYLKERPSESADLILFDLGISSFHYKVSGRGFSFSRDEGLDMRLDKDQALSAENVVNDYSEDELKRVIREYGEERYSGRIARAIVSERAKGRITSSEALADAIKAAVPPQYRYGRIHPATRSFQAIRIEVNGELRRIDRALGDAVRVLKPKGRVAVITFHSLEDRIVKWFFKNRAKDVGDIEILTKKPIVPSDEEESENPPSRSAKLRIAEKKEIDNE